MSKGGFVVGDGGSILKVQIVDSATDTAIDLTGKTVKLRYKLNGGTLAQKTMTALDQTQFKGWAQYNFLTTDLTADGDLEVETRVNDGEPDQLTSDSTFHIAVRAPLT